MEYTSLWAGFELTTLVLTATDCTSSGKSNYYANTITTVSLKKVMKYSKLYIDLWQNTDLQQEVIDANLQNWNKMCFWKVYLIITIVYAIS